MNDGEWKRLFETSERPASLSPCPAPEVAATWASGPLPPYAVSHLAACASCREVLVVLRRPPAPVRLPSALRNRIAGRPPRTLYGVAAAAAVVIAVLGVTLFPGPEPSPTPVAARPPLPKPNVVLPEPTPTPEPPKPAPLPEPAPVPEKPAPSPTPEPPVVVTPRFTPPKLEPVVPVPEKPAPEPTRATLKGTVLSIAGSCSTQSEADAAQPLKPGQKREFPGIVRVKADNAVKFAIGTTTYYVQRSSELAIQLQEGRTSVKLAKGEAFFDVTPGNGVFEVEGAAGKVVVKGTRFLVSETEVLVQRGTVEHTTGGQTSTLAPKPKADLSRRLAWVRGLEDTIWIEAEQLTAQGMAVMADATASGGRAIGLTKGAEGSAEIRGKRKQAVPYAVWVRLLWPHNVPSALALSVGDLHWSSKDIASAPAWQWVRAGNAELEEAFRLRLSDTKVGLKVDQLLITSDLDYTPETDKR